jgi:hypothetical protein
MKKIFNNKEEFWDFINGETLPLGKVWINDDKIIFEDGFDNAKEIIYNYYNSVLDLWNT